MDFLASLFGLVRVLLGPVCALALVFSVVILGTWVCVFMYLYENGVSAHAAESAWLLAYHADLQHMPIINGHLRRQGRRLTQWFSKS